MDADVISGAVTAVGDKDLPAHAAAGDSDRLRRGLQRKVAAPDLEGCPTGVAAKGASRRGTAADRGAQCGFIVVKVKGGGQRRTGTETHSSARGNLNFQIDTAAGELQRAIGKFENRTGPREEIFGNDPGPGELAAEGRRRRSGKTVIAAGGEQLGQEIRGLGAVGVGRIQRHRQYLTHIHRARVAADGERHVRLRTLQLIIRRDGEKHVIRVGQLVLTRPGTTGAVLDQQLGR